MILSVTWREWLIELFGNFFIPRARGAAKPSRRFGIQSFIAFVSDG